MLARHHRNAQEEVFDPQQALKKNLERVFDGANRLHKILGAAGQTTTYGYDPNNNVTTVTDPLGRATTNTYDPLNRLTNINDPTNGNTVFTYDAKDRLLTVKDPKITATTSYTYDGVGASQRRAGRLGRLLDAKLQKRQEIWQAMAGCGHLLR